MRKFTIRDAFAIAVVCVAALDAKIMAQSSTAATTSQSTQPSKRIYSCGANSLFVLSKLMDRPATYVECATLLPIHDTGNTMLEVRDAVQAIGLQTRAMRLGPHELQRVRVPCIAWLPPLFNRTVVQGDHVTGHYIVIRPVSDGKIQILNYPEHPTTVDVIAWGKHLESLGIEGIPVLLCARDSAEAGAAADMLIADPRLFDKLADNCDITVVVLQDGVNDEAVLRWNFGEAPEGALLKKSLVIANSTHKEIEITRVLSGCTCAQLAADTMRLAPGQKATIGVTIDLSDRVGKQSIQGRIMFAAQSALPPAAIDISGTVRPRWRLESSEIDFGCIDRTAGNCKRRTVIRPTEFAGEMDLAVAKSSLKPVAVRLTRAMDLENRPYWLVEVELDPSEVAANVRGEIEIYTPVGQRPVLRIPFRGEVANGLAIRPNRLLLTRERQAITLDVDVNNGGTCQITDTRIEPAELASAIDVEASHSSQTAQHCTIKIKRSLLKPCSGVLVMDVAFPAKGRVETVRVPVFVFTDSIEQPDTNEQAASLSASELKR